MIVKNAFWLCPNIGEMKTAKPDPHVLKHCNLDPSPI